MRKKKNKNKVLKPRIPVWKTKPEQTHKSAKSYDRKKTNREIREIEKLVTSEKDVD